jgi:hypothetical protein
MKSKCAVWLTAILFAAAAGMLAQDNPDKSSPPPAPQTSPVPETSPVPPAPAEPGNPPPAENPALPQASPVLPQTAPSMTAPAPESKAGAAPVDTIEKKASRRAEASSRKSAKKTVEPAPAPQAESKDKDKEKAAAGAASIDMNGSGNGNAPGSSPPSGTVENGAPPPAPVVENSAIEETRSSKTDVRERGMGVGSWILIAIVFLGVIGAVALAIGNDTRDERISIVDPDLGPSPRSPLSHTRLS